MGSDRRTVAVVILAGVLVGISPVAPALAHPENETDHGIDERTFVVLWSGDEDGNVTTQAGDGELAALRQLANGTDIPLNSPPQAAERWNRGDLADFPETDEDVSVHPPDADTKDGRFVKDAYAELFAVQPSTRARLSESQTPLYVAPDGNALGTADYRVDVPEDDTTGDRRVYWNLQSYRIDATRLLVDGEVETTDGGSHTVDLAYSDIDDYRGERHTLTLEAEITVTLEKHVRTKERHCRRMGNSTTCWTEWDNEYTYPTETVRVSDSVTVEEYDLAVSGFVARYPNGDLGFVVYKNEPWLGHSVPNGDARGVWRFYSARDSDWDTLVRSTEDGSTRTHSPLHPLQVNAFPMKTGPSARDRHVEILGAYGETTQPPSLPENVNLDVATEPYTASYGIATRTATDNAFSGLQAWGLVRGVTVEATESDFARIEIRRSNLTLSTVHSSENATTVRVRLEDAATGQPINTAGREGYVVLDGQRLNTTGNGTAMVTITRSNAVVSARYEPGRWWRNTPGYVGDSAKIHVGGTALELIVTLSRFFVPVGLFLLTVYVVDRVTQSGIWPPWRGL
ncbi:MAG: hypothetical protein V5A21_11885 [Halapricum sp.]